MKLNYITYQSFPAFTANSLQTMTHIKYFSKLDLDVLLIFPLRNKESVSDLETLKTFYQIEEDFEVHGTIHPLPFKKFSYFEKYTYLISHLIWSFFISKKLNNHKDEYFFTRSEWIFYFLSKKKYNIIYECHQLSNLKINLIKKSLKSLNSRIILLNDIMFNELRMSDNDNISIIPSAYDEEIFKKNNTNKKIKKIIYAGSFFRFGESRGLENLLNAFRELSKNNIETKLVANDENDINRFKQLSQAKNMIEPLSFYSGLKRKQVASLYSECKVGILINNDSQHAEKYTSPLKYFEYLSSGLQVVASKHEAHKSLPFQDRIIYFEKNNSQSFLKAVNEALNSEYIIPENLDDYSMTSRVKKIIGLFN